MGSRIELRLPPGSIAPTLARAAVAAVGSGLPETTASDAELLTTEIVANAVRHANLDPSQEIVLRLELDRRFRVEVVDPGPRFEANPRKPDEGTSGWGLFLVDALAASWGVEGEGAGKKVWFEVGIR